MTEPTQDNDGEDDIPVRLPGGIVVSMRVYKFLEKEKFSHTRMAAFIDNASACGLHFTDDPLSVLSRSETVRRTLRGMRIARLESGNHQFGHAGTHHGVGSSDCPRASHHHCDEFCDPPTFSEIVMAGLDPKTFRPKSRR